MPVFNGEKFLIESILSVINQDYSNWELLIINDGSTDRSKEIALSFNDKRIHYFEQPNKGVSAARNIGLQNMKGDYFCFLDADDCLTTNSISERLKIFLESASTQFVDGKIEICDSALIDVVRIRTATAKGNPFPYLISLDPGVFFGPTWMVKRSQGVTYAFNEEMKYLEDLYFYFKISTQGNYAFTSEVVLRYRKHDQSAMQNLDGIAQGYSQLVANVKCDFSRTLSFLKFLMFDLRVRKIMFLSFLASNQKTKALKYFVFGHL